jgi:hypothetical protein
MMAQHRVAKKAYTGRWGFRGIFKHFSGFEFFLLPSIVHARPSAMLRERKPLGFFFHRLWCMKV